MADLERQQRLIALGMMLLLSAGSVSVGCEYDWPSALRWALLPFLGMAYSLWFLGRHLNENTRSDGVLLSFLGWGNVLTLIRASLLASLSGFLLLPRPTGAFAWGLGLLYTLAVTIDFFDGYVARLTRHTTPLGERLDMEFDGWGLLTASILAVQYGQAPGWYVLAGLARYLYVGGLALRARLGLVNHLLPGNLTRRLFAGAQMGLSCTLLWPGFGPPGTFWAVGLISLPHLLGFGKDWLLVCGWLKPGFGARWERLAAWLSRWLPVGLRAAAALVGLSSLGWLPPAFWPWTVGAAFLLGLGVAPRLAATAGLLLAGLMPFGDTAAWLMALCSGILYLGGGRLSLWKPEEGLFLRRAGEKVGQKG